MPRYCIVEGCNVCCTFNYPDKNEAKYCSTHKKIDMVNVTHQKCIKEGCSVIASYNYPNTIKRLYCTKHKKENMVSLTRKKKFSENTYFRVNDRYKFKSTSINPKINYEMLKKYMAEVK